MKRLATYLLAMLFIAAGTSTRAAADSTANYSITGTYGAGTLSTALSESGDSFTMNFSVPTNPGALVVDSMIGDDFYLYPVNISYGFGGSTTTLVGALLAFYSTTSGSQPGGLFIDYCVSPTCLGDLEYQWTFGGPQQYTGSEDNPTIVPTSFVPTYQGVAIYPTAGDDVYTSSFSSIAVNGKPVNTPEPSSLLLLGAGLAGIALLTKLRG